MKLKVEVTLSRIDKALESKNVLNRKKNEMVN